MSLINVKNMLLSWWYLTSIFPFFQFQMHHRSAMFGIGWGMAGIWYVYLFFYSNAGISCGPPDLILVNFFIRFKIKIWLSQFCLRTTVQDLRCSLQEQDSLGCLFIGGLQTSWVLSLANNFNQDCFIQCGVVKCFLKKMAMKGSSNDRIVIRDIYIEYTR